MENPYSLVFGHMRLQAFVDVEKQLHYHCRKILSEERRFYCYFS